MTQPGKQSRARLDRDQVVRAAIELADAGGTRSLTMRKLGAELGVDAMSLYHHVANKNDLLNGMIDAVFAEIELPPGDVDWRTRASRSPPPPTRTPRWTATSTASPCRRPACPSTARRKAPNSRTRSWPGSTRPTTRTSPSCHRPRPPARLHLPRRVRDRARPPPRRHRASPHDDSIPRCLSTVVLHRGDSAPRAGRRMLTLPGFPRSA